MHHKWNALSFLNLNPFLRFKTFGAIIFLNKLSVFSLSWRIISIQGKTFTNQSIYRSPIKPFYGKVSSLGLYMEFHNWRGLPASFSEACTAICHFLVSTEDWFQDLPRIPTFVGAHALESALCMWSSVAMNSTNHNTVCVCWKNPHMSGLALLKPKLLKGQL